MTKVKWYVVIVGKKPGIYQSWEEVAPKVLGVSKAIYKSYSTQEEAFIAYGKARMSGLTEVVGASSSGNSNSSGCERSVTNSPDINGNRENLNARPSASSVSTRITNPKGDVIPSSQTSPSKSRGIANRSNGKHVNDGTRSSSASSNSPILSGPSQETRDSVALPKSRKPDTGKSRKGKEVATSQRSSDSVSSDTPHTTLRIKSSQLKHGLLDPGPSSISEGFALERRKLRSPDERQLTEVEEEHSPVLSSPATGITYCSDRSEFDTHLPEKTPLLRNTIPKPASVDDVFSNPSASPVLASSPSSSQRRTDRNRRDVDNSQPHAHHPTPLPIQFPQIPAEYCQCDIVCPHCNRPKVIYVATCQAPVPIPMPLQATDVNAGQSQPQPPTSPSHGVPVPLSQPIYWGNIVYDTTHDPRSPISRTTLVPEQPGSSSPLFGRPSPLVSLGVALSSFYT